MARRPPKVVNQCKDGSVYLPLAGRAALQPTQATELSPEQVYLLYSITRGVGMAEACNDLFGFTPGEHCADHLAWMVERHPEWESNARYERDPGEWFSWRYGREYDPARDRVERRDGKVMARDRKTGLPLTPKET